MMLAETKRAAEEAEKSQLGGMSAEARERLLEEREAAAAHEKARDKMLKKQISSCKDKLHCVLHTQVHCYGYCGSSGTFHQTTVYYMFVKGYNTTLWGRSSRVMSSPSTSHPPFSSSAT